MKATLTGILAFVTSAVSISSFDIGERALTNFFLTPACAQSCILNPRLVRKYAPECINIPIGMEYGTKLCQNHLYQHMLDNCFKEICNDQDRNEVYISILLVYSLSRPGNWEKTLARVTGSTSSYHPGVQLYRLISISDAFRD